MTLVNMNSFRYPSLAEKVTIPNDTETLFARAGERPPIVALEASYDTIDIELDQHEPIFWCWMSPLGKPIVSSALLTDLKAMHRTLPSILDAHTERPVEYYVFASRSRGTY